MNREYNTESQQGLKPEKVVESGEEQTRLRRMKRKLINNLRKNPHLQHADPEIIWQELDKMDLFRETKLPYQKVRREKDKRY